MVKKGVVGSLIFILILLCSLTAFASFTDEWGEFQDDHTNRGFVHDETGNWDDTTTVLTSFAFARGTTGFQPLVIDNVTGVNSLAIFLIDDQKLKVYQSNGALVDETSDFNYDIPPTVTRVSGQNYIIVGNDTYINFYTFNGSDLTLNRSAPAETEPKTALKCNPDVTNACYYFTALADVCEVNVLSGNASCQTGGNQSFLELGFYPAIEDVDRDGSNELIISARTNAGATGTLWAFAWDITSDNMDTGFSGDGIWSEVQSDFSSTSISSPSIHNINGAGDWEIAFTSGGKDSPSDHGRVYMIVLEADGTEFSTLNSKNYETAELLTHTFTDTSPVVYCDLGDAQFQLCFYYASASTGSAADEERIFCYDPDGSQSLASPGNYFRSALAGVSGEIGFACADMDGNVNDEFVTTHSIFDSSGIVVRNLTSFTSNKLYQLALADVNQDGDLDIVYSKASDSQIVYSGFTNGVPTLYNNLTGGGYYGYYNPVCVNTTITFQAQESGGTAVGNYFNDASEDTERITTNCGQDDNNNPTSNPLYNTANGTFSLATPTFDCFYNVTGVFPVRLYLQDDSNPTDFTVFNTQTIALSVINGQPGITCNNPSTIALSVDDISPTTPVTTFTGDTDIDNLLGIVTGGSTTMNMIVGAGIVFALSISGAKVGGIMGAGIGAVMGLIIVTFIGMFPSWVMIITLLSLALIMVLRAFMLKE